MINKKEIYSLYRPINTYIGLYIRKSIGRLAMIFLLTQIFLKIYVKYR